jgi:hypothetical protein
MTIEQVCIRCPNCARSIVLPRQSHLGKFDGQITPSMDIWPINFLCLPCGLVSEIQSRAIHLEELEMQDQYQLVRYDFASDQSGALAHVPIYTREARLESLTDSKEYVPEAKRKTAYWCSLGYGVTPTATRLTLALIGDVYTIRL